MNDKRLIDWIGQKEFDLLKEEGGNTLLFGIPVSEMTDDEMRATIGWIGKNLQNLPRGRGPTLE